MKPEESEGPEPSRTVTVRLPSDFVQMLERRASQSLMKRGTYIARILLDDTPEEWPALAVLGRVIAIEKMVAASGRMDAEQLRDLRSIVRELAQAAHAEVTR